MQKRHLIKRDTVLCNIGRKLSVQDSLRMDF